MASFLGVLNGFLYSIMNLFNAQLSTLYGNYLATVIIHVVGLLCVIPFAIVKRRTGKGAPWWMYAGGALGIITVLASNLGIQYTGVTVTLVLALLGQMAASTIIDHFGLFGFKQYKINKKKVISLVLIACGAAVMILW